VIPPGSEQSPAVTTSTGIFQLMESVACDRMIVVSRGNSASKNREISDDQVKADTAGILACMIPAGGRTSVTIFTLPKEESEMWVRWREIKKEGNCDR
jgi:hypothetical protein